MPAAAETYRLLGACFEGEAGHAEEAVRAYEKYRELGGTDAAALRRLEELRGGTSAGSAR
jgi:hypothetical protein